MKRSMAGRRRSHLAPPAGESEKEVPMSRLTWGVDKLVTPVLVGGALALFGILAPPWIADRLQKPTCQDPRELTQATPRSVDGGSKKADTFVNKGPVNYAATNLVDGNTSTAWVEGEDGLGLGAQVTIRFDPRVDVRLICIVDGYAESWDLYKRNSRVRQLSVSTEQGTRSALLADAGSPDRPAVYQQVNSEPGVTSYVDLKITSAYAAQRDTAVTLAYPDTSISEVEIWITK